MIRASGLTKTFHRNKEKIEAVKGIDVTVSEGELVAFLGPNGAGKSTTLRMLTSLLPPTAGSAQVAGWDVTTHPAQVRSQIGYIGQGNGGGYSYRVLDELHNQGRFYGLRPAEYRRRATELVEALELGGLAKRTVQSLSGGQRRRLDVAMGLMNHPPLLFLDEPSTGLDPHSRANLWEHITAMRAELGMTLVLTTHYLDEADNMAERVVVIDHGEIIADAPPSVLKREFADDTVTLTVSGDSAALAERLRPSWAQAVHRVRSGAEQVVVTTTNGPESVPAILDAARAAEITVTAVDVRQASLDDVFLSLTGRSLREEAQS